MFWEGQAGYSSSSTGRGSLDTALHILAGAGWIQLFMSCQVQAGYSSSCSGRVRLDTALYLLVGAETKAFHLLVLVKTGWTHQWMNMMDVSM